MKILNLYAGIGGNRKLWPSVWGGAKVEVTAVEINPEIAKIYSDFFPEDKVIVGDAHQYLLEHYEEFDFVWSSPPCPSHSRTNMYLNPQGIKRYPDLRLYEEIILLQTFFKGKYCVENVISYYDPLITPQLSGRHYFWCNFPITNKKEKSRFNISNARTTTRLESEVYKKSLEEYHGISVSHYKQDGLDLRKILRNCVNPRLGLHIFNEAFKVKQMVLVTPTP